MAPASAWSKSTIVAVRLERSCILSEERTNARASRETKISTAMRWGYPVSSAWGCLVFFIAVILAILIYKSFDYFY